MALLKFGDYEFPDTDLKVSTDFGATLPNYLRMAGLQGEIRIEGSGLAVRGKGTIDVSGSLISNIPETTGMLSKRNALRALPQQGIQRLEYTDGGTNRYCYAEASVPSLEEDHGELGSWLQPYQVMFTAPESVWYVRDDANVPWRFDSGYSLGQMESGNPLRWGTGFVADANTGSRLLKVGPVGAGAGEYDSTTEILSYSITHAGTAASWLVLSLRLDAFSTTSTKDIEIHRYVAGTRRDWLKLGKRSAAYTHGIGSQYDVDGRAQVLLWNAQRIIPDDGDFQHPRLLKLSPGENQFQIRNLLATDTWRIFHWWDEAYL